MSLDDLRAVRDGLASLLRPTAKAILGLAVLIALVKLCTGCLSVEVAAGASLVGTAVTVEVDQVEPPALPYHSGRRGPVYMKRDHSRDPIDRAVKRWKGRR